MAAPIFIGRKNELERLEALYKKKTPSLVVVKGRRRVGKSRLINFFASNTQNKLWNFAGLAPQNGMDHQTQRDYFARQLASHLKLPPFTFEDWSDAFEHLSGRLKPISH